MVFVPIPNTARCELRYTQDSQLVANIFHVEAAGALTVSDLNTIGSVFVNWWSGISSMVAASVSFREIDLRDLTTSSGIGILYNVGLPLSGSGVSPQLPNNNTISIKWGTGLTGRSFRGRSYHIGLMEANVTGNTVDGTFLSDLLLGYNDLITQMTTAGYTLVVASRYSNNSPRVTGVTTPILTASVADATVDSQRKRLPGRGR